MSLLGPALAARGSGCETPDMERGIVYLSLSLLLERQRRDERREFLTGLKC